MVGPDWNKRIALLCGAMVILGTIALFWRRYSQKSAATDVETLESPSIGDIAEHFEELGEIKAKDSVDVASKVSGRVLAVYVQEGDKIRKDQKLFFIQPGRSESEKYVPITVTAPIAGTVMRYVPDSLMDPYQQDQPNFVHVGDYVSGLMEFSKPTYLMTVADLSRLIVRMEISEMDVVKLAQGMPVSVSLDAIAGETFNGSISLISPQAQKGRDGSNVFEVDVALQNSDSKIRLGMMAHIDALVAQRTHVLKVPLDAVFEDDGQDYVYLDRGKQEAQKMKIELGLRSDMEAEVTKAAGNLSPRDKLLTQLPGK